MDVGILVCVIVMGICAAILWGIGCWQEEIGIMGWIHKKLHQRALDKSMAKHLELLQSDVYLHEYDDNLTNALNARTISANIAADNTPESKKQQAISAIVNKIIDIIKRKVSESVFEGNGNVTLIISRSTLDVWINTLLAPNFNTDIILYLASNHVEIAYRVSLYFRRQGYSVKQHISDDNIEYMIDWSNAQ